MYQKITNYNLNNSECDNCSKKSVCKYAEQFKKYTKEIQSVKKEVGSPFHTVIMCSEFQLNKITRDFTNTSISGYSASNS